MDEAVENYNQTYTKYSRTQERKERIQEVFVDSFVLSINNQAAMFQKPIIVGATRILNSAQNSARNRSIRVRAVRNIRTISLFPSIVSDAGDTNAAIDNRSNTPTKPQQALYHKTHSYTTTRNTTSSPKINNIHRRSMVTITNTKSSDLAPLFSPHVVDDVSSSSPSASTYVVNEDTTIIVTESCLKQIERLLKQRREREKQPENYDDGYFLRVFVDAGGCSGFQYQFEVDNELDEDEDVVVVMAKVSEDQNDANGNTVMRPRVVVDQTSMGFLEGSTIDYVIEMIKSAFVVSDNPQSESACGCGSSFAMKNFEKFGAKD